MPSLMLFVLLFSSLLEAKTNWCQFDSDLAEEYMKARANYAAKLRRDKAEKWNGPEDYNSGSRRRKEHGHKWETISLKNELKRLYGDREMVFKAKDNGKLLIYPKDMADNTPVILLDPSGDYARILKGKIKDGEVKDTHSAYTLKGPIPEPPPGVKKRDWEDQHISQTHFLVKP